MTMQDVEQTNVVNLGTDEDQAVAFNTADIEGLTLTDSGALQVTFKDGSHYTISNFRELAENEVSLVTEDGGRLDSRVLFENLSGGFAPRALQQPEPGTRLTYELEPGLKYSFDLNTDQGYETAQQDGALVITFADGGILVLQNFDDAMNADLAAQIRQGSEDVSLQDFLQALEAGAGIDQDEPQQVAESNIRRSGDDDMARLAEALSDVEPAAGEGGAQGGRGGFGFQSNFAATDIIPLNDIGPIGPTELHFGLPEFDERLFVETNEEPSIPPLDPPSITVNNGTDNVLVKEDMSVDVPVVSELAAGSPPTAYLTITITGFDPSWGTVTAPVGSFNAAGTEWSITLPAGENLDTVFNFTPAPDSDIDLTGLVATVEAYDPATDQSADAFDNFDVIVDAVADEPLISAEGGKVWQDNEISLDIEGQLTDLSGSERITHYEISGVPAGFSFNQGTDLGGGVWSFDPAELGGLVINAPAGHSGALNLTATVFNTESPVTDGEWDFSDNDNQASADFCVQWLGNPDITVNNGIDDVLVKEDHSVDVPVVATLDPNGSANEVLTVTITGFDPSWGTVTAPVGSFNADGTAWSVTLPAGENLDTVFNFTPAPDSDIDLTGLVATVSAYDPEAGLSAEASDNFDVIVDAVADEPLISAEGGKTWQTMTIDIDIEGELTDLSGSERITHYEISGVPDGFSFNQGVDLGGGVWFFTPSELEGLTMSAPADYSGNMTLTATVFNTEAPVTDGEWDFSDNDNQASTSFTVKWKPVGTDFDAPDALKVDETNLADGNDVVNGAVTAEFAVGSGTFAANDSFNYGGSVAGGALTSGGVPVEVTLAGNVYTGKAGDEEIFTLTLQADGSFEFVLTGTLDHADASDPADIITLQFGATATDSEGLSSADGFITIKVLDDGPVAENDFGTLGATDTSTAGNVLGNDTLSQDGPNLVTQIQFGSDNVDVPESGTVTIDGDYGVLEIAADGSYTYTRTSHESTGASDTVYSLDPQPSDVAGSQTSFTKNDITISIGEPQPGSSISAGGDLKWHDKGEGAGIGIGDNGSGDNKVWPKGETLVVDPANDASSLKLTLADIGSNNIGHPLSVKIYFADGTDTTVTFNVPNPPPADYLWDITIDSADHGGKLIDKVDLFNSPGDKSVSFMLNNVEVTSPANPPCETKTDEFTYVVTDHDGDTSSATLTIDAECLAVTEFITPDAVKVDETNLAGGNDMASGTVTADFGTAGSGTFAANDSFNYGGSVAGGALTSGGVPVEVALDGNVYTGKAGDEEIFTLTLQADGNFEFVLTGTLDHADASDPADIITLQFGATATDSEGFSSADGFITIKVLDDGPVAENDFGALGATDIVTTGNVLDNDTLSQDGPNLVTKIQFGSDNVDVPESGTVTIEGHHGTLEIAADGSYSYTRLSSNSAGTDKFTYTLTDSDGDNSQARLTIDAECLAVTEFITPDAKKVDETNLAGGPDTVSGAVTAEFTVGSGSFTANNNFNYGGSVAGGALTSGGVPVEVALDGNVYTGKAGDEEIFTLTLQADGNFEFVLTGTLDHADASDPADIITLQFGATATDSEGFSSADGFITIKVLDDGPVAENDFHQFDRADGVATGNVTDNDTLSQDSPNLVTKIQFGGQAIDVPESGTATIDGDYGTLEIASDGSYSYTLFPGSGGTGETTVSGASATLSGKYGVEIDMQAREAEGGVEFTVTLVNGKADLNGFFLDIGGDGGSVFSIGSPANNMHGTNGFDYAVELGSVGGHDKDVTEATFVIEGITLSDLENANAGIRATSVGKKSEKSLKLEAPIVIETVTEPDCDKCKTDEFTYTLTDHDGDSSSAVLALCAEGGPEAPALTLKVNNGADSVVVKEDHWVFVEVQAQLSGETDGTHTVLTLSGVDESWDFSGSGWTQTGTPGQYSLSLPPGATSYEGGFTFAPPTDSDIDLSGLTVTADVYRGDDMVVSAQDGFDIIVDAVADIPNLEVTDFWAHAGHGGSKDYDLGDRVEASLNDTDGSEKLTLEVTLPPGLLAWGAVLSHGVEVSAGVWEVAEADIDNLVLTVQDMPGIDYIDGGTVTTEVPWWHDPASWTKTEYDTTYHKFDIEIKAIAEEQVTPDDAPDNIEVDFSDNVAYLADTLTFTVKQKTATTTTYVKVPEEMPDWWACPIVIDLDGNGIDLVSVAEGVSFDLTGDGIAENTGWIGEGTGLLAWDQNGNGQIDGINELFGSPVLDGFALLAQHDSNGDGVIDAQDDIWSSLTIWQDASQNGTVQPGEMKTLDYYGITAINLDTQSVSETIEGNQVFMTGSFVREDGSTGLAADVMFALENPSQNLTVREAIDDVAERLTGDDFGGAAQGIVDMLFRHNALADDLDPAQADDYAALVETYLTEKAQGGDTADLGALGDLMLIGNASPALEEGDVYSPESSDDLLSQLLSDHGASNNDAGQQNLATFDMALLLQENDSDTQESIDEFVYETAMQSSVFITSSTSATNDNSSSYALEGLNGIEMAELLNNIVATGS